MSDWFHNLPLEGMAFCVLLAAYLVSGGIYLVVTRLALNERAGRAFKAVSPGMLPPLGIIFGLLAGFIVAEAWNDFERAKVAVATEASALRAVALLAETLPVDQKTRIHSLINRHIEEAVNQDWPAMRHQRATFPTSSTALFKALEGTLALKPTDDSQRMVQQEIVKALRMAQASRIQRIVISQSGISSVEWVVILLQGVCALVAIAMVHSDNRLTCAIALTLFATGFALSVLLISSYNHPFSGDNSADSDILKQVMTSVSAATQQSGPKK